MTGNKKGIDHFVKYLSWLDDSGKTRVQLLDIDGSLSNTVACAQAIQSSLKKLNLGGRTVVLRGQTTDSGGGGVLETLARELNALSLCTSSDEYFVASCGIHCLQLQLANPVKQLIGLGGLGKRNAIQMLHTIYDLQGYLNVDVMKKTMTKAQEWADKYCDKDFVPDDPTNVGDAQFAERYNKIRKWRTFDPVGKKKWTQISACVLTRWQYTGEAAKYGFENYLVIFKFAQLCINAFPSGNKINKTASDLQSLMMDPIIYSDMCLIHCFHDFYFKKYLDWMMQSKDLTEECGFQSHQMLATYYRMHCDLEDMKLEVDLSLDDVGNGYFFPYIQSLDNLDTPSQSDPDYQKAVMSNEDQRRKGLKWVDIAVDSLNTHFIRWASVKLLPAALMSEDPLAKCVARLIVGAPPADPVLEHYPCPPGASPEPPVEKAFKSDVFKCGIKISRFESWLRTTFDRVKAGADDGAGGHVDVPTFSDDVKAAAQLLLNGTDFRVLDDDSHRLVWEMHSSFLPLASQTQFVERGVKDAQNVAVTGRQEEQRSNYCIVRSFHVLGIEAEAEAEADEDADTNTTNKVATPEKIKILMARAERAEERLENIILEIGEDKYDEEFKECGAMLKGGGHFRYVRNQGVIDEIAAAAEVNKVSNVRQQQTGVHVTAEGLGLISYSKLRMKDHKEDIKIELAARGFTDFNYPATHEKKAGKPMNFTDLKKMLMSMELLRVKTIEPTNTNLHEIAKDKGFEKQSTAEFKMAK